MKGVELAAEKTSVGCKGQWVKEEIEGYNGG